MKFTVKGEGTFEADDLEDAYRRLGLYFVGIAIDDEDLSCTLVWDGGRSPVVVPASGGYTLPPRVNIAAPLWDTLDDEEDDTTEEPELDGPR